MDQSEFETKTLQNKQSKNIYQLDLKRSMQKKVYLEYSSPLYQMDLNEDTIVENIQYDFKDGHTIFKILNIDSKIIFQKKIRADGYFSGIYKISLAKLDNTWRALIISFYDGIRGNIDKNATSTAYLLAFNKNLTRFAFTKGAKIWFERKKGKKQYTNREYKTFIKDLDRDGTKEVITSDSKNQYVFKFLRNEVSWVKI
jgi:hypothetical protein